MNRKVVAFVSVLLVLFSVFYFFKNFSVVTEGKIQPKDYIILRWGTENDEVGIKGPYENFWYFGPGTFDVDKFGNAYITDQLKSRIIEVNNKSKIIKSISIKKITPQDAPEDLLPVRLIVSENRIFLLHRYRGGAYVPSINTDSEFVTVIKNGKVVKIIDAKKVLGQPIDVHMKRLVGDKVVLLSDIPPEDMATWKNPKAIVVDKNGNIKTLSKLINGGYDKDTPVVSLVYEEDKKTHAYRNARIRVKDPVTDRTVFLSPSIENGKPIYYSFGPQLTGNKVTYMYQTGEDGSVNSKDTPVITHIAMYDILSKKEEHYELIETKIDLKDMLPPPFTYKTDFVLGNDGYFYRILYMKDGLHIRRFEPSDIHTDYFIKGHKL